MPEPDPARHPRRPRPWLCALLLLIATPLHALDPKLRLSQYDIDCFGIADGLPHSSAPFLTQDRDGYLLVASLRGAVRFDGVRMRDLTPVGSEPIATGSVERLLATSEGSTLIGTSEQGLLRVREDGVHVFGREGNPPQGNISHLVEMEPGRVLVGTPTAMLELDLADNRINARPELPAAMRALARAPDETLWIGTQEGLYRVQPGTAPERMDTQLALPDAWVWSLHFDPEGALWIGTRSGLVRWRDNSATQFGASDGLAVPATRSVLSDRDGQLWVATAGGGLHRRVGERFETLNSLNGLSSDIVWRIFEDASGNLWVGTAGGICRLRNADFAAFTRRDGLGSEFVWSVAFDAAPGASPGVWVGSNGGGLNHIREGRVTSLGAPPSPSAAVIQSLLPEAPGQVLLGTRAGLFRYADGAFTQIDPDWQRPTLSLARDDAGTVWIGSDSGLARLDAGKVRMLEFPRNESSPVRVQSLAAARDGGLWVASSAGLFHLGNGRLQALPLELPRVRAVYEDARGVLWIAGSGLDRYFQGQLTHYGAGAGFQDSFVHSVLPDDAGFLWISTNIGVWRAPIAQLDRRAAGDPAPIGFERFAERHGMRNSETNGGSPNMIIGADRQLWLATMGGVATVRVDELARKPPPRVARVERVIVDGTAAAPASFGALGPEVGRLDIEYTAFEMRTPEAVVFRHRLLPLDRLWIPAQDTRSVSYRRLPPGHYRFELQASLEPLVFAGPVAAVEFTIQPHWYQGNWFRASLLMLLVALGTGVPLMRIRTLRAQEARLQQEVLARTHDLAEANQKLDLAARTDVLTGVANRREFGERLAAAFDSAGTPHLSLALCDIDHFKAYNDAYGHLQGDECLRMVAQTLASSLRSRGALVARYGGEEFAVLLHDCSLAEAHELLECARRAIGELQLPHSTSSVSAWVSISAGVAQARPGMDARGLIDAADHALYSAKHLGRDRVEIAL